MYICVMCTFSRSFYDPRCLGIWLNLFSFCYNLQEMIVIDDLLSCLVGIEGRYISIKRVKGNVDSISFQIDASMDLALQV